ncbi:S8 family serine peptidase [Actinoplanes sp. NBRC 103695]|uniref:S8 family serine peptidase n=1 Tax=Actinoplanes sp. NBRC 103695 TaxID=3032202 RepID=UPI0024A0771B|nr:S8 family serine peptidase [Actinoplanes sp. NBRC 103695]GLY95978.1 type VII secretion-associated serine protease [Actinoplanes sp. NBRC 103695]
MIRSRSNRLLAAAAIALAVTAVPAAPASADSVRDKQWHLKALDIAEAHRISTGAGVTVGLIDSGVDAKHRDLRSALLPGIDTNPLGSADGLEDRDGHGTEMAGIIAGRGHGGDNGVLGIAPSAKVLSIGAPTEGLSDGTGIVKAIDYAVEHGVKVINMSFVRPSSASLQEAIRRARAADIVLVGGSGNKGEAAKGAYPALYPEVLSVGAIGRDGNVADFSVANEGVDIVAPGVDIVSTGITKSGYSLSRGTSQATAVVSGAAALIRAKYPDLSAADVIHRLTATATDAGPEGRDDSYGFGRLNLVKALTDDVGPAPADSAAAPTGSADEPVQAAPPGDSDPSDTVRLREVVPIVLGVLAALLVLAIGAVIIVVMIRRQRRT